MTRTIGRVSSAAAALVIVGSFSILSHAQTMGRPEKYSANAVNINVGAQERIEIAVERWSSDAERDKLMSVMLNQGAEKLLDTLQDMRSAGYFHTPGNLRWEIRFARKVPLPDGGERVVLMTDRRIGFWEAATRPRSIDYPFTVIELRLNKDGEGEGKISLATKIIPDKEANIVTLENYDMQPVMLRLVRREKSTD